MPFPGRPNEPFFWGSGGRRRTPQDIALERERAMQMQAAGADFSPVGHWTQGLARLATGIGGALQNKRLDKQEAANRAESDAVAAALMGGGTGNGPPTMDAVMQALLNPNIDPNVRQFAQMQWERMQPKAQEPLEFERLLANAGIMPGTPEFAEANRKAAEAKYDPLLTATLPGERFFSGRQSQLATVFGGGQPQQAAPRVAPPKEAVMELLQNPDTAQQFDEIFGAGASAEVFAAREGFREATGR